MGARYRLMAALAACLLVPGVSFAKKHWSDYLQNWKIHLDNGQVYVDATNMPVHCSYSRAIIQTDLGEYQKDLYAFILMSYATKRKLTLVLDDAEQNCVVYGARN